MLPKCMKDFNVPTMFLNSRQLWWVSEQKYCGIFININSSSDWDVTRLCSKYCKSITLISKFINVQVRLKFNDLSLVVATCTVAHCGLSKWNASILGCELLTKTCLVYYCTLIIEWYICKAFIDFDEDCFSVLMRNMF